MQSKIGKNFADMEKLHYPLHIEEDLRFFTIGYTKPFKSKAAEVYANVINLNQNPDTSPELKIFFQDWQNRITRNGELIIDIFDFNYEVIC